MMKQPHCVTKLRLTKICRWLFALGFIKLCIFAALVAGYPLPEISWNFKQIAQNKDQQAPIAQERTSTGLPQAETVVPENTQSTAQAEHIIPEGLQGSAAARAAANIRPSGNNGALLGLAAVGASPVVQQEAGKFTHASENAFANETVKVSHETANERPLVAVGSTVGPETNARPSVIAAQAESPATVGDTVQHRPSAQGQLPALGTKEDKVDKADADWWNNLKQIRVLPFPRLGLDQVAHAATLDTPPPPQIPPRANDSSVTPPAQAIPDGQNADGSPLPPRSTAARPLPAGSVGPQSGFGTNTPSAFTPAKTPPAPKVDTYVPPEDPNRQKQELARREQEVLMLKQQMEQRLDELQVTEKKVQGMLREAKEVEEKKVNTLSAMYMNMKPKQAAKVLEALDERTAAKILLSMSAKQSGDILTYTDPMKTAKLTELINRMRITQ